MQRPEAEHVLTPVSRSHPHPSQLERFMTSALSRSEVAPIVRHLLKGCPKCAQVTRQLWRFGDEARLKPRRQEAVRHD